LQAVLFHLSQTDNVRNGSAKGLRKKTVTILSVGNKHLVGFHGSNGKLTLRLRQIAISSEPGSAQTLNVGNRLQRVSTGILLRWINEA
jgi:hypothetical protein